MNLFKNLFVLLLFIFIFSTSLLYAQTDNDFKNNIDLFNNKLYSLAHLKFLELIEQSQNINVIEKSYYYAALSSYYSKNFNNSLSEFTSLLINFPNTRYYRSVKRYIAFSYFYSKNYVYAVKSFKNYLKEFPKEDSVKFKFFLAQSYFYMEYFDKAFQLLKDLVNDNSLDDSIRYNILFLTGQIYYYEKNYEEALKRFNIIINKSSIRYLINNSLFLSGLVTFYMNKKEASAGIFQSLKGKEGIKEEILSVSDLFIRLNNKDLTELFLLEFISKNKNKELLNFAYLNLINIYIKEQKFNKAETTIEQGLELEMLQDHYFRLFVKISIQQNDFEEAEIYLKKIIEDYPGSVFLGEVLYNLALIEFQNKEYQRAEELLDQINDTEVSRLLKTSILFKRGEIEYLRKNYKKAKEIFLSVIKPENKKHPFFKNGIIYLSDIYSAEGNDPEKINLLEKYIKEFDDYSLFYKLAISYLNMKKYTKSLYLIKDILDNSNDAKINYRTFMILVRISEVLSDEKEFRKYLFKLRNNQYFSEKKYIDLLIKLSLINIKNKNFKEAVKNLQYAVTLKPALYQKKHIYFDLYKSYLSFNKDKAAKILDRLLEIEKDENKIISYLYFKAQLYKKLNLMAKYTQMLQEIMKYKKLSDNEYFLKAKEELKR